MNTSNQIFSVAQYNLMAGTENLRPRSNSGTYRKTGYVVTNGQTTAWYSSIGEANEAAKQEMDNECHCSMSNEAAMNN